MSQYESYYMPLNGLIQSFTVSYEEKRKGVLRQTLTSSRFDGETSVNAQEVNFFKSKLFSPAARWETPINRRESVKTSLLQTPLRPIKE